MGYWIERKLFNQSDW